MSNSEHVLISLEKRHAENIFAKKKRVELRRRAMRIDPGTTVWIYVKLPIGSILGHAIVANTYAMSPANLWRRFASVSGLQEREFFEYFDGIPVGFALDLKDSCLLSSPVNLKALRGVANGFQPPQFYARVQSGSPLLQEISNQNPALRGKVSTRGSC